MRECLRASGVLSDLLYMARLLDMLVRMIKVKDEIAVLRAVLVQSKRFLDVFLRRFMPRMAAWFSKHTDAVMDVILTLQKSTRALQHACNHVKGSKDPQVVSAVPQLKKMLELLLFRVRRERARVLRVRADARRSSSVC